MSRICDICGRGALSAQSRSHSNIATKRRQHVNLQKTLINGKRVKACTNCIKTQTKKAK
ncbi:MAG: 50S ribosomal protein L28 [Patescibacteria group bacterium]|jgi:large subunit ribosomal protein L28